MTDTIEASGLAAREVTVASRPNPMAGPFYIEGAEPGDTLTVRIDRLTPSRATGWTYSPLALTVLDTAVIIDRPSQRRVVWDTPSGCRPFRIASNKSGASSISRSKVPSYCRK